MDPDWIKQQANTNRKIYILMPRKNYNLDIPNVIFLPYYEWDHDCAKNVSDGFLIYNKRGNQIQIQCYLQSDYTKQNLDYN